MELLPYPRKDEDTIYIYGKADCGACERATELSEELGLKVEHFDISDLRGAPPVGWQKSFNAEVLSAYELYDEVTPVIWYDGSFISLKQLRAIHAATGSSVSA